MPPTCEIKPFFRHPRYLADAPGPSRTNTPALARTWQRSQTAREFGVQSPNQMQNRRQLHEHERAGESSESLGFPDSGSSVLLQCL